METTGSQYAFLCKIKISQFLIALIKYSGESRKEKGFISVRRSRHMEGKCGEQEPEVAGHVTFTMRNRSELLSLLSLFYTV